MTAELRAAIEDLCTFLAEHVEELRTQAEECAKYGQFESAETAREMADEREKTINAARALINKER